MMDQSYYSQNEGTPVYLNIYSFCHCCNLVFGKIGLGLYHTAIQIYGVQFMFHGWAGTSTGVSEIIPKTCPYRFEQQIQLGRINYGFSQLDQKIIEPLKKKYISTNYLMQVIHMTYQITIAIILLQKWLRDQVQETHTLKHIFLEQQTSSTCFVAVCLPAYCPVDQSGLQVQSNSRNNCNKFAILRSNTKTVINQDTDSQQRNKKPKLLEKTKPSQQYTLEDVNKDLGSFRFVRIKDDFMKIFSK